MLRVRKIKTIEEFVFQDGRNNFYLGRLPYMRRCLEMALKYVNPNNIEILGEPLGRIYSPETITCYLAVNKIGMTGGEAIDEVATTYYNLIDRYLQGIVK